jgi:hypothetical protein
MVKPFSLADKTAIALAAVSGLISLFFLYATFNTWRASYSGTREELIGVALISLWVSGPAALVAVGIATVRSFRSRVPLLLSWAALLACVLVLVLASRS